MHESLITCNVKLFISCLNDVFIAYSWEVRVWNTLLSSWSLIGVSWYNPCFCQFPSRSLCTQNWLYLLLPLLSRAGIFFLFKDFSSRACYFSRQRGISFVLPPVMRGQEREPRHRSQTGSSLPLLTMRSEKSKDVSCLSLWEQKEEVSSMTSRRASADVAGIPPARAAIWGSPAEYSRSACC